MTRQEAIKVLKTQIRETSTLFTDEENFEVWNHKIKRLNEAYNMAIEALEKAEEQRWIPIDEQLPDPDELILLSFENFGGVMIGRYTVDDEDGGTFRIGDMDESFVKHDFYVNAWCKLPEPYKAKEGMKPNKRGYIYYCAKCGCDVGSYGLASGKIHKDTKCRKCGTVVDWE